MSMKNKSMTTVIKIFLTLFFLAFTPLVAQEASSTTTDTEIQNSEDIKKFIEVSEVSEKSASALVTLKEILKATSLPENISEIHQSIPSYISSIETVLASSHYEQIENLNIRKLQEMQGELTTYTTSLDEWKVLLKSRVEIYDENRELLKLENELWLQTEQNALKENAPEAIQEQIKSILKQFLEVEKSSKKNYDELLTDLNSITTKLIEIKTTSEVLKKAEIKASNNIFSQNSLPLFELISISSLSPLNFVESIKNNLLWHYGEASNYFEMQTKKMPTFLVTMTLLTLLVLYFTYLYFQKRLFVKESSLHKKEFFFMRMPVATILILLALVVVSLFIDRPKSVTQLLLLVLILPVARIVEVFIEKGYKKYLFLFLGLFLFQVLQMNSSASELESRLFSIVLSAGLFYFIYMVIKHSAFDSIVNQYVKPMATKLLLLFLFLIVVATMANIYGSILLASRVISGIFITIYTALLFYTMYIVLSGYIVIIFRRRVDSTSNMLELYSQKIEKTTITIIKIGMFLWWLKVLFVTLSIYPIFLEYLHEFLALSWTISATVISVESVVDFIAIIIGTWMLSKVVVTILNVEVFARFSFPRGIPTAITTTLNYIIVISGVIIALSSLGVTPEQFTLVFGALGVGIGFGLRNIIANFVSGVIMVFERPVQIGDTIEVNNTLGSVQSIGARSTTIKTFDGSEVIIPNADFIAKDITNWTLSDEHRRKLVVFKVDYDSNVEQVLSIMKEVAMSHPDVLKDPEPVATFKGFGENYLEFKLYFWLTENLMIAPSDVSIGIYKALKESGVKMPMPKQETYLKKIEDEIG